MMILVSSQMKNANLNLNPKGCLIADSGECFRRFRGLVGTGHFIVLVIFALSITSVFPAPGALDRAFARAEEVKSDLGASNDFANAGLPEYMEKLSR